MGTTIYSELANLQIFRERLIDEESKELLDNYVESLVCEYHGREQFQSTIYDRIWGYDMYPDGDFDRFMEGRDKSKIIIFGAGHDGRLVKRMLEKTGMFPRFFCDNNVQGRIDGLEVISPELLRSNYHDHVVILASRKYGGGVLLEQLLHLFFPQENIYCPRDGILRVNVGWQYFGMPYFRKSSDEVFLDCGCLNGATVFDFIKWCNGNYKKIYCFEPDKENFVKCKRNLSGLEKVELHNVGLWNKEDILRFSDGKEGASRIAADGQAEIKVLRIDDILKDRPATFIKMDIEGAELNALQGAEITIKTYYPKLAISVYHKWTDLIEIPAFLMNIAPKYHYAIRHHTSRFGEMVLYAWI